MIQNFYLDHALMLILASSLLSTFLGWLSIKIAPEIGLMDIPGSAEHKNHSNPIPLTGGIVLIDLLIIMVLLDFIVALPNLVPLDYQLPNMELNHNQMEIHIPMLLEIGLLFSMLRELLIVQIIGQVSLVVMK